jgi:predicted transcriptional regulator/transcriptional regulator with XRE-family HTH domain
VTRDLTGLKIRALRREKGLAQGELARRAGISPSYLNLIERNKRAVAGALLDRIAEGLGVHRRLLDEESDRRIVDALEEMPADPLFAHETGHPGATVELVGRYPEWAKLMLRLYQAYQDRNQAVLALADRLNRDPFLGESIHQVLTHVTAIRAAAEIIEDEEALPEDDQEKFLSIISSDARRLSEVAQALAGFFDSSHVRIGSATPMEHVDAYILEHHNYFQELEDVAADLLRQSLPGEPAEAMLTRLLKADASTALPDVALSPASIRFVRTRQLIAGPVAEAVKNLTEKAPALADEEARRLAAAALESYAAAALLMPYDAFLEAAEASRYDLDVLARRFEVSYEQAAHRLATLQRPGAKGLRFAFMRSDPSGYVTKRLPLPRLPLPRYGTACPLWVVYGAFQTPGVTARSYGELPTGEQFFFFARAVEKLSTPPGYPRRLLSVMLALPAEEAHRVSAADGLDRSSALVPVGTVCRLCPREACLHRQEAPLINLRR